MSESFRPIDLVFIWHHHQPDYRSARDGRSLLPWVRLHGTKDYRDMATHLERHPGVRAAFNFVPSLVDQIEEAVRGGDDALFALLSKPVEKLDESDRLELIRRCTIAPRHALETWPAYRRLIDRARRAARTGGRNDRFADTELEALRAWFLLAWLDPVYRGEPEAAAALSAGELDASHRNALLTLHARLLAEVLPAYRSLERAGQIELSASPYHHPILPLVIDVASARRARPDLPLPTEPFAAAADAAEQIRRGLERHEQTFGERPAGMWPPEGSVSPEAAELAARAGVRWIASDERVLWRSLGQGGPRGQLYQPWSVSTAAGSIAIFFRDLELSDRIGFVYQHWRTEDAVADFITRVRRIAREHAGPGVPVASVILDGENCWEHYVDDGAPFLDALYSALEAAEDIRTRTPREVLVDHPQPPALPRLHSGSWIDADFHIWVGHPEKNRAWDLLARTRRALAAAGTAPPAARDLLYAAEGSDLFWWLGVDHHTDDKHLFDRLFRERLQKIYELMGQEPPGWLMVPVITRGVRGRQTQPVALIRPVLDGLRTTFYEWHGAGRYPLANGGGSMHRGTSVAGDLFVGFDLERLYLRLDFADGAPGADFDLTAEVLSPRAARAVIRGLSVGERTVEDGQGAPIAGSACCVAEIVELAIPFKALGLEPDQEVEMLLRLSIGGQAGETLPGDEMICFRVPDAMFEAEMWSV
jgi:alpha-amylase/alpha-mannosidase (GH57 family)